MKRLLTIIIAALTLSSCSTSTPATKTIASTTPATLASTAPTTMPTETTTPKTVAVSTTTPNTKLVTTPTEENENLIQFVINSLEDDFGDFFNIDIDRELKMFRLEPKEATKMSIAMVEDSTGPMADWWEEMKEDILSFSKELYTLLPNYFTAIPNWGEYSDQVIFAVINDEILEDVVSQ